MLTKSLSLDLITNLCSKDFVERDLHLTLIPEWQQESGLLVLKFPLITLIQKPYYSWFIEQFFLK